jgi:exodeoxyribonuclease V beta subunit
VNHPPFDIHEPLPPGRLVVEAGAGTGKTHTIASIVTRLVAEEGIAIDRILVVTFTRAATAELRHRVRQRMVETLRSDPADAGPAGDPSRRRLAEAARRFDRAQIFTIHGFATRLLGKLGFRARLSPDSEPQTIDEHLLVHTASDLVASRYADNPESSAVVDRETAVTLGRVVAGVPDGLVVPDSASVHGSVRERVEVATAMARELRRRMRLQGTATFDDGLVEVRDALAELGAEARAMIDAAYDVALVDEAQDTDPVQWEVMRAAFGHSRLVVIGDPKQSIYRFRGADVESYLSAVADAHTVRTLDTNWRSDGRLLGALDHLLGGATFGDERIRYRPVGAAEGHRRDRIAGGGAPLRIRRLAPGIDVPRKGNGHVLLEPARRRVAEDAAAETVRLLGSGITIEGLPLGPADIAVLCRTRRQVDMVREELTTRRVPSVAARTGGVFESEAAEQWRRLLLAVERPDRLDYVRLASTTVLVGRTTVEAAQIDDESVLDLQLMCRSWHTLLQDHGVPALLAQLDHHTGLSARVLRRPQGERLMTDLVHIAEEIHAEWRRGRIGSLVGWLEAAQAEARRKADSGGEEPESRQRRLETDADAVQVLTVHGAKGLEYPVVLIPYAWDPLTVRPAIPVFHAPEDHERRRRRMIDVGGPGAPEFGQHRAAAVAEDAAEEGRLLYVALTRARHHVEVWWVPEHSEARSSKLGELVAGEGRDLETLVAGSGGSIDTTVLAGAAAVEEYQPPGTEPVAPVSARFTRSVDHSWRRASFSSLSPEHPLATIADTAETPLREDEGTADVDATEPSPGAALPLADLPRGARFGTLVHDLLEHLDLGAADLADRARLEVERLTGPDWDLDPQTLVDGIVSVVDTPLGPAADAPRLSGLRSMAEMTFDLPVRTSGLPVTLGSMGRIIAAHLPSSHPYHSYALRLGERTNEGFRGYLTGAIDLTARTTGGRFVVIDYKTNTLPTLGTAPSAADYGPAPLAEAMVDGHYVLQATIYQIALHRYLQWRLAGYDPERHLGGSMYLFLRGMVGPDTPVMDGERCGVARWHPPAGMIVELSGLLAGREVRA